MADRMHSRTPPGIVWTSRLTGKFEQRIDFDPRTITASQVIQVVRCR